MKSLDYQYIIVFNFNTVNTIVLSILRSLDEHKNGDTTYKMNSFTGPHGPRLLDDGDDIVYWKLKAEEWEC